MRWNNLLILAALVAAPTSAAALDLNLSCQGQGEKVVPNTAFAFVNGSRGSASGTLTTMEHRERAETIGVAISGDTGKVQVPRNLLPALHSSSSDGWWPLTDVTVSDTEIRGHYTLNPFNHPEVRIDRLSGAISIDGYRQSFRGTCSVVDPAARKF